MKHSTESSAVGHVMSDDPTWGKRTIVAVGCGEDGGSTFRVVEYVPAPGVAMDRERSRCWTADLDDVSPMYGIAGLHGQTGYDGRCAWCYLGATHSARAHAAKTAGHVKAWKGGMGA